MSARTGSLGLRHIRGIREKSVCQQDRARPSAGSGGSSKSVLLASLSIPDQAASPESVQHHPLLTTPQDPPSLFVRESNLPTVAAAGSSNMWITSV